MLVSVRFLLNNGKPKTRIETLEGKEYLVAPMVMIVEGVFEGSDGPIYYPSEELAKTPESWNHKPIVNYHPEENGSGISACSPIVIETRKVGLIMNTTYKSGNKLAAEAWLDQEKLKKVDDRVLKMIQNGEPVEVSTGLFVDQEQTDEKEFKGKKYSKIAKNIRPDHLAILPDRKGACSLTDGAGLLVNERKSEKDPNSLSVTLNEESFRQIESKVHKTLAAKYGKPGQHWPGYIHELYGDEVIYSTSNWDDDGFYSYSDGLFSHKYQRGSDESITLIGEPVAMKRVTSYQPVNSLTSNQSSEEEMTKKEKVKLILNSNLGFKPEDTEMLEKSPDGFLDSVLASKKPDPTPTPVPTSAPTPAPVPAVVTTPAPAVPAEPQTAEQYIANAPPAVREMLQNALAHQKAMKATLVEKLVGNSRNQFTKEYLEQRSLEELNGMVALIGETVPTQNQSVLQPNYGLAAGTTPVPVTTNQEKEGVLELPKMF